MNRDPDDVELFAFGLAVEDDAQCCCAHLHIENRREYAEVGLVVRDWWECRDCKTEFRPVRPMADVAAPTSGERELVLATVLAAYGMPDQFTRKAAREILDCVASTGAAAGEPTDAVIDAAKAMCVAWEKGWDCSASPGHPGVEKAYQALCAALWSGAALRSAAPVAAPTDVLREMAVQGAKDDATLAEVEGRIASDYRAAVAAPDNVTSEALRLLWTFVDDEPCQLDHHGNCQAHNLGNPCNVEQARKFLVRAAVAAPGAGEATEVHRQEGA
jgi:hypothetical protein